MSLPLPVGSAASVDEAGRWVAGAVAAILAAERAGTPVASVGPAPTGAVGAVRRHRVTTLVAPHAAAVGFDEGAAGRLDTLRFNDIALGLAMVVHTRAASGVLAAAGVDHLVVKGVALTAAVGRTPATRGHGDIDLWVRQADLGRAEAALADAGWERRPDTAGLPAVGAGWRWGLVQWVGSELALDHPERATVDLHWRLAHDPGDLPFGFEEAWAASVPLDEVGMGVRGLCPRHALAHVAYHARKEHFCILRQVVDVTDTAGACRPDELATLAQEDPNVALALAVVAPLAPWLADVAPADRRVSRLADEARRELGSLRWTHTAVRSARGASRMPTRWAKESWLVRSAPRRRLVLHHLLRSLVPLRLLTDRSPVRNRRHAPARLAGVRTPDQLVASRPAASSAETKSSTSARTVSDSAP